MAVTKASPIRKNQIVKVVWLITTVSLLGAAEGRQKSANQPAGPAEVAFAPQVPPPITRSQPARVVVNLEVTEQNGELARGIIYNFWMYNGHVPGPFIRVRVGDTVEVHLKNRSSDKTHTVDFHFVSGPGGRAPKLMANPGRNRWEHSKRSSRAYSSITARPILCTHGQWALWSRVGRTRGRLAKSGSRVLRDAE